MKNKLESVLDQAEEGYLIPCRREDGTIDLHARASNGDTLLHVAVGQRDFSSISALLEAGLDINAKGDYFQTPFYSAASSSDIGLMGFLLQRGADPSIPDNRGTLPCETLLWRLKNMGEDQLLRLSKLHSAAIQDQPTKINKKQNKSEQATPRKPSD